MLGVTGVSSTNARPRTPTGDPEPAPEGKTGRWDDRTDDHLIADCLRGDSDAWQALLERYGRLVYSIPLRYGLSSDEAAEVFQSVCLILLEKLEGVRDRAKLSSWLITVTARECWAVLRRRSPVVHGPAQPDDESDTSEEADDAPLPDEVALQWERQHAVRAAVRRLPERCQRLLWYLFYDHSCPPYAEIGRRIGIPVPSIGPTRARCLEKLRGTLEAQGF